MTTERLIHGIVGIVFWIGYLIFQKRRYTVPEYLGIFCALLLGTWVPDWDLWFGIGWHRSPFFHSALPVIAFTYAIRPLSAFTLPVGFALGVASHLFWDIIFYGDVKLIPSGAFDRLFLLLNCLALVGYASLKKDKSLVHLYS